MLVLAKLIAIIIFATGVVFLLKPEMMKKIMALIEKKNRIYGVGVARVLVGLIFLASSSHCRIVWVVVIFGAIFLLAGIAIFVLGKDKCKKIIKKWHDKAIAKMRPIGLIPLIIGLILIFSM